MPHPVIINLDLPRIRVRGSFWFCFKKFEHKYPIRSLSIRLFGISVSIRRFHQIWTKFPRENKYYSSTRKNLEKYLVVKTFHANFGRDFFNLPKFDFLGSRVSKGVVSNPIGLPSGVTYTHLWPTSTISEAKLVVVDSIQYIS